MKRHSVLRRCVLTAGLCLLLFGTLVVSLWWATTSSSLPVADLQARAGGEVASAATPAPSEETASARTAQPVRSHTDRSTQDVSAKAAPPKPNAERAVQEAWERARKAGVYGFATELTQLAYPTRSLANVGRGPDRVGMRMEGEIDQPARTLEFRLRQPGMTGAGGAGSAMTPGSGADSSAEASAEAHIEGDHTYVRPAGGDWKEVEDFSASFAPDNDPLAFLGGIKNVRETPTEEFLRGSRGADEQGSAARGAGENALTLHVSRFTFQLDGPALATYLRDRLERQLTERGELPLGVTLEASSSFRQMTGSGELWVDARGLPLRLAMHLAFPEQRDGSHLEADIQTDFSGFPEELAAAPKFTEDPLAWADFLIMQSPFVNRESSIQGAAKAGSAGGALACSLGTIVLLLACRRSRRLYAAVVVAVILSMVVVPLMQSERAVAFFDRQAARSQDLMSLGVSAQAINPENAQAADDVANYLAPSWNPQQDPLAQPDRAVPQVGDAPGLVNDSAGPTAPGGVFSEEAAAHVPANSRGPLAVTPTPTPTPDPCAQEGTTDPDNDGVNDHEECAYSLDSSNADSDSDGLTDGQELYKLGTNGNDVDTDGDMITDTLEVKGFIYPEGGQRWYLNPSDADTNVDGLIDSVECPALVDTANPTAADFRDQCDTDRDGIPNLFESDNDNDGVPDRVDLSPDEWADAKGKRSGQVTDVTPFNSKKPFTLTVQSLQEEWPVLVDLQMRPITPTHLAYSMNVLDWPGGDVDGQIQHKADTTFKESNNDDISNPDDDAGANGDMRLVPLLEVVITGAQIPLKLTEPAMTAIVGSGTALSSTVSLAPAANPTDTQFTFDLPQEASLEVYEGACAAQGKLLATFPGSTDTITGKRVVELADDNHALVVKTGAQQECAEIPDVVNGPYPDQMVDLSVLSPYGITARDQVQGGVPSVVVYVPLNVATDDTGGGKTAFQSHMVYWVGGDSAWVEPQQMRIIWLVQMLTDTCADGAPTWEKYEAQYKKDHPKATDQEAQDAFNAAFDAYCATNRTIDQILPVQLYDESWTLAGLSVREDHGLDVAVAYINPDLPEYDDDALWTLSWGLGQQFVPQRNCETDATIWNDIDPDLNDDDPDTCLPDGKRDLTVLFRAPKTDHSEHDIGNSTIKQRFDYTTTVPLNQRWGIQATDGKPFPLRVENFRYKDQDYLGYLSTTETPRILAKYSHEVTPTLLYAREERYRAAGLEAGVGANGGALTVDLNTEDYQEETLAGLQWAPYRYNKDKQEWEAYPSTEYWDAQGEELEAEFYEIYKDDSVETNLGRVTTARAYSFALINGVANTFRCSPEDLLCAVEKGSSASDVNIIKAGFAVGTGTTSVIQKVLVDFLERRAYINDPTKFEGDEGPFWSLGEALVNEGSAYGTVFTASPRVKLAGGIVVAAAAVVIITTVVVSLVLGMDSAQVVAVVLRGVALGIAVQCTIQTFARQWTKWQAAADHPSFMDFSKSKFGLKWDMTLKLGLVFTFISVAITWGAFVTQFFVTNMKWGSMSTDSAFAGAIAATIVTVILFLIFTALGPIGAIVGAIFGLINAMASLICSALPQKMQSSKAGVWLCGGITGAITNLMKRLIYSGTIMVKMAPTDYDRLSLHHFDTKLADEEAGVVVGNKMIYSVQLTNTIDLVSVPISLWEGDWGYQFNDANLMQANFGYRWQESQNNFHSELSLGSMPGGWQRTYGGRPFYTAKPATSEGIILRKAGINRPVEGLYLSEAYAVPEQECWGFLAIGKCSIEAEKSTSHFDMGSDLVYDVLPPTLDGFYELKQEDDGWALAWGQEGDLTFQPLFDADGDGLSRTDDPDDSNWDADDDGLSDVYELNTGSDPTEQDTDDDGLTDHQEAQFGSNPASADGDGDGLYDCQEVFHEILTVGDENVREACGDVVHDWSGGWTIVYGTDEGAPTITHVTSNPVEVDTEGDGLTDRQEQVYGYNPRVWSIANVLALSSELSEVDNGVYEPTDGFVAPGQTLHYNATVKNKLDSRQAEGLLWTETTPFLDMSNLRPQPFNLRPQTQASMAGTLSVLNKASGAYSITQVAGALIENLAIESNEAALWLRFDDATAPFADWSGSLPPHDGACFDGNGASATACAQDADGGRIGGGLKLAGTGYVEVPLNVSEGAYALALWFKTTCTTCGIFSVDKGTRGAGGHDRHVYLNAGNVCARVYSNEIKCTSGTNYADGQWHHVVHTFGGTEGGQKIYLDGVLGITPGLKAASDFTAQDGINIGFSNDAALGYFIGSIDDVRLFSSALDQTEVRALANLPLFHMNFDQTDRWADVSSFKTPVSDCVPCTMPYPNNRPPYCATSSCRSYYGPAHDTMAVHGSAANFNGSTYLSVPGGPTAPQLDLGGGRFTLSAWIYPRTHGDARDTHAQGILGLNSGNSNAFPTLQRVGKEIRFSLGTGAAWVTPYTSSGNVLTENQWNHVAVTLNKDEGLLRLYVNGELKGSPQPFAVPVIAATRSFDIGRSSSTATVRAYNYTQGEHGDGGLSCECLAGNGSEMCMALDSQEVWDQDGDLCCTEQGSLDATRSFAGSTTLVLWEDDDDPHCGTGPSEAPTNAGNDDDTCTFTSPSTGNQLQFSTRDASFSGREYEFNNCGTGDFRVTLTNNSVPFYGYMDELQIYGQTLDQDAIRQLYLDAATLLRLPLDEAPGAAAFEDLSLAHVPAFCAASGCPASGTTGRINQAAQFDSSKGSTISLGHSAANELAKSFSVAAWIKPKSVSGVQNIVSTARTKTNNGWGFRLSGGNLAFEPYGYGTSSTSSLGLQSGRWTHVAAVVDAANAVTFYVNGVKWESMSHSGYYGGGADADDLMLVGAAQELGAAAPSQFFDGQIDDLWVFNMPLSPARITELYERAPVMHLLFDEATGAHQFADNAAYGRFATCTADGACPLAGEGVRGEVGLAAKFDGLNDNVKIDNFGDFTEATVSAWVYRTGGTTARETIVSYKENSSCGFVLDLNDDAKNHYPRFYVKVQPASGSATWQSVTFPQSVPSGTWVHLAGTYDGSKIRLYQNGVLQAESNGTVAAGSMLNTCTDNTRIGSHNSLNQHWFPGAIDEVQIYGRALTSGQIRDLYLYQSAWVESRQSRDITVDNDPPTAKLLIANGSYLADQTIWIGVTANDPTSDVDKVELRVDKGSVEGTWRTAARCTKNTDQPEGAWCAQFTPWGDPSQGAYSLFARATDRVGRIGPYDKVGVYVDDMAPTLVLNQISYALVDAHMSGKKPQTWVIHLSGVVKDPLVATNVQGSGVPVDGVRVTLRDAEGEPLGDARQTATVSGNGWSLDYTIRKAEPDGCYAVEVEAEDQVARIPNLDPYQVGRHTTMVSDRIVLESSAPQVLLDQQPAIAGRQLGPGVTSLGGETTHRPVPVEVDLTATTGADKTRVLLTCQHGNEGSWYTLFDLQAGTLKAGSTQVWEGDIHQWSTCRVDLTTTATPVGGVGGVVKVCGTQIADWSDGFAGPKTVEFVVYSDSCGAPGCPVGSPPPVAGVQGVDLAFRSVLPGSAFFNEVPSADEILHLPFEDTPDSGGGLTLRDVSSSAANAPCGSGACPGMGQASPSGSAALFDGKDDYVEVPLNVSETAYALALWFKSTCTNCGIFSVDAGTRGANGHDRHLYLSNGNVCARVYSSETKCTSGMNWADGKWHHVVHTFGGTQGGQKIYLDGVLKVSGAKAASNFTTQDGINIGFSNDGAQDYFAGLLDEVRLFSRALTLDEVNALYTGSGPVLVLPFEEPWAADGADLPDDSGWEHNGTLETGDAAANKATTGQVGAYALKLDGANDNVRIANFGAFGTTTVSAWVNRAKADTARQTIVSYRENLGCGFVFAVEGNIPKFWVNVGGAWRGPAVGSVQIPTNQWEHLTGSYDGTTIRVYRNGVQAGAFAYTGSMKHDCTDTTAIGSRNDNQQHWFPGTIDEVRIYGRALPPQEIADLYHAGWQAATLPSGAVGTERTSWTAAVPTGLEGSYRIEMRGRDVAERAEVVNEPSLLWRGEADNLKPRVTLSLNTTTNQYTTVAEDYHLVETSFSSPCGAGVINTRETFRSPWYLGSTGDSQKLYRLKAVCPKPAGAVTEQATACDSFNNCTTVVGATTTAQLTAAESAASNPELVAPDKGGPSGFEISAPAVVTTSHYYEPRTIDVIGAAIAKGNLYADRHALANVQVAIAGAAGPATLSEPAAQRPYTITWTFPWRLPNTATLPDGVSYTAAITATDLAGRTTAVKQPLIADVVRPAPVTLNLTSNGQPVEPGAIIRETAPDLALTWTSSSDGSGLSPYQASWRIEDAYTTTIQTSLHTPDDRVAHVIAGEAQQIAVGLTSRDIHSNERWQEFGSVLVDGPLTPDFITPLPSPALGSVAGGDAWMDSGCTLLGADRRITDLGSSGRILPLSLQRRIAQHGYVTWDHRALRLAWTGANWSDDGDLFIYLDTVPDGTNSTFTPYPITTSGTTVILPADLQADALIWVRDATTASLLRWDGNLWAFEASLSPEQYHFDAARNGGQTDLYLPFELLGLSDGDPLGALAFAAEEPAPATGLRIWATLPLANPVNSSRVNRRLAFAPAGSTLTLLHAGRWAALGDGVCPNGTNGVLAAEQHNDTALQMTIESDPPGATASGLSGGLFWAGSPSTALGMLDRDSLFGFLHPAHPPLPDGQAIAYTVRYRNNGSHTLEGAWLDLSAFGALELTDNRIELGDIQPGGEGTRTFGGTVKSRVGLAAVLARLHAATSGPDESLEWLVAAHRIDRGAPEKVGLNAPEALVGLRGSWLGGYSHDESGVRQVEIEILGPSGATSTLTCIVSDPATGRWSCPWNATAANGGEPPANDDQFTVRLRATDRFGQTSSWSAPHTIRVDAQPPTITLAAMATDAYAGRLVRGNALRLLGSTQDNTKVGSVTVCLDAETCEKADLSAPTAGSSRWARWVVADGALDYVTKTLTIRATDRLGNRMAQALALPVVFDNVAPVLNANQILARVTVSSTQTVLNGDVSDGGPDVTVSVRVQPPNADVTRIAAARGESTWSFDLPGDVPGRYTLWADAEDRAGNVTTAGPFTVDVVCTDAAPVATRLTAEPVAGWPISLTLTTVISNAGPELLPAGMPVALNEGATYITSMTTTVPLKPGESQALSIVWAPDATRDYNIAVTVGQTTSRDTGGVGDLSNGPLCFTPPTTHFILPVHGLTLYYAWTLISPPVNPSNAGVQVVQRGIDGPYATILGYDGVLLAYYPDRPQDSTLQTVDALHGYWIRTILAPGQPATDTLRGEPEAMWRIAGEILPEDQPLTLASGWNLAGYLPRQPLTVTTALQGIAGRYDAVLGFERTALSYYPDLDASYNTLYRMAPGYGYWISATQAITLQYPATGITRTLPMTTTRGAMERLRPALRAEWDAGVQPTYEWMNFYGKPALPDGTAVPTGTVVLAVDPQGVICGATTTWEVGQYGLLACYRDDPYTPEDEGALPGDPIRLVISADGTHPDGRVVGTGTWTAHGARQQVPGGQQPELPHKTYLPLLLREGSPGVEEAEPQPEPGSGS